MQALWLQWGRFGLEKSSGIARLKAPELYGYSGTASRSQSLLHSSFRPPWRKAEVVQDLGRPAQGCRLGQRRRGDVVECGRISRKRGDPRGRRRWYAGPCCWRWCTFFRFSGTTVQRGGAAAELAAHASVVTPALSGAFKWPANIPSRPFRPRSNLCPARRKPCSHVRIMAK